LEVDGHKFQKNSQVGLKTRLKIGFILLSKKTMIFAMSVLNPLYLQTKNKNKKLRKIF